MPFKSKAQMRYMFATHPDIAEEFARKTKNFKKLPNKATLSTRFPKVKRGKNGKRRTQRKRSAKSY